MENTIRITQIKSTINRPKKQKQTIKALGLGKVNRCKIVKITPQIQGMINKVKHLIKIQ